MREPSAPASFETAGSVAVSASVLADGLHAVSINANAGTAQSNNRRDGLFILVLSLGFFSAVHSILEVT